MPEMLGPTGAMIGAGLANSCCLLTDGRFSGASRGFIVVRLSRFLADSVADRLSQGHITPEAFDGGPIALVEDGDTIIVDSVSCNIEVVVSDEVLAKRRDKWVQPERKHTRGVLFRYARVRRRCPTRRSEALMGFLCRMSRVRSLERTLIRREPRTDGPVLLSPSLATLPALYLLSKRPGSRGWAKKEDRG